MRLILAVASTACVLSYTLMPGRIFDSDTLWHIKAGEWILSHRAVPSSDPFSWSAAGAPWLAHEWLFELALAASAKIGTAGIAIFSTLLILAGLFMYWKLIRAVSASATTAAMIYVFALLSLQAGWSARPQIAGYAFFIATLYLLYTGRNQPCRLWLLPAIFLLWANCHASVVLGLGLAGLEASLSFLPDFEVGNLKHTSRNRKVLPLVFGSCLLASLVNPHGINLWIYAFKVSSDPAYKAIMEWQPPSSASFTALIFLILLIAISFMATRKNKADLLLYIVALLTLFGTMTSARHFMYFVLAWAILTAQLAGRMEFSSKMVSALGALLAIVFLIKLSFSGWPISDPRDLAEKAGWPVNAVDWIEENHAEKVFNYYNWGGYLIYRGIPVFVDGRADMYHMAGAGLDAFAAHNSFYKFEQPPVKILENWGANYVLLPDSAPHLQYLKECGWVEVYKDEKSAVMERGAR